MYLFQTLDEYFLFCFLKVLKIQAALFLNIKLHSNCFQLKDFHNKITIFISTITGWFTLAYPFQPRETCMTHLTVKWGIPRLTRDGFHLLLKLILCQAVVEVIISY